MDLQEKLTETVTLMKEIKTAWVDTKPENTDLAMYLHFWRGDQIVAALQTKLDRDIGLQAGQAGAMGFNADVMSISFESYFSKLKVSPVTGQPWLHRELQYVHETTPDAHEKGWVDSCISVAIHERGGEYGFVSQPYVLKDGGVIFPDDLQQASPKNEDAEAGGAMFDYLQSAMAAPTINDRMKEAINGGNDPIGQLMAGLVDDPEARLFHTDMATYKALEERDLITGIMFGATPGSNRAEWLKERLGEPNDSFWDKEVSDAGLGEGS